MPLEPQNLRVFKCTVWRTSAILSSCKDLDTAVSDDELLRSVLNVVRAYEDRHLSQVVGNRNQKRLKVTFKELFDYERDESTPFHDFRSSKDGTGRISQHFVLDHINSVITAYKIIDWGLSLEPSGRHVAQPVRVHPRRAHFHFPDRLWAPMSSLHGLITQAEQLMARYQAQQQQPFQSQERVARLAHMVYRFSTTAGACVILSKFSMAALHLLLLKQEGGTLLTANLGEAEQEHLRQVFCVEGDPNFDIKKFLKAFTVPLSCAVLLDPVFLLSRTKFEDGIQLEELHDASIRLGSERPARLDQLNKALFRIIVKVALENVSEYDLSQLLINTLQQHRDVGQEHDQWYKFADVSRLTPKDSLILTDTSKGLVRGDTTSDDTVAGPGRVEDARGVGSVVAEKAVVQDGEVKEAVVPQEDGEVGENNETIVVEKHGDEGKEDEQAIVEQMGRQEEVGMSGQGHEQAREDRQDDGPLVVEGGRDEHVVVVVVDRNSAGSVSTGDEVEVQRMVLSNEDRSPVLAADDALGIEDGTGGLGGGQVRAEHTASSPSDSNSVTKAQPQTAAIDTDEDADAQGSDDDMVVDSVAPPNAEWTASDEEMEQGALKSDEDEDKDMGRRSSQSDDDDDEEQAQACQEQRAGPSNQPLQPSSSSHDPKRGRSESPQSSPSRPNKKRKKPPFPFSHPKTPASVWSTQTRSQGPVRDQSPSPHPPSTPPVSPPPSRSPSPALGPQTPQPLPLAPPIPSPPSPEPHAPSGPGFRLVSQTPLVHHGLPTPSTSVFARPRHDSDSHFRHPSPSGSAAPNPFMLTPVSLGPRFSPGPSLVATPLPKLTLKLPARVPAPIDTSESIDTSEDMDLSPLSPSPLDLKGKAVDIGATLAESARPSTSVPLLQQHVVPEVPVSALKAMYRLYQPVHGPLDIDDAPTLRFKGNTAMLWDVRGQAKDFEPSFYRPMHKTFWDSVNEKSKRPVLLPYDPLRDYSTPAPHSQSLTVLLIDNAAYRGLSSSKLAQLNAYVDGLLVVEPNVVEMTVHDALKCVGPLDITRKAHDMREEDTKVDATLAQFETLHLRPLSEQIGLNFLDLPSTRDDDGPPHHRDKGVWHASNGSAIHVFKPWPQDHFSWFLGALPGCVHGWHMDPEGLATEVMPLTGAKAWYLCKDPRSPSHSDLPFVRHPLEEYDMPKNLDVYALLLEPGMRLVMPPGTTHAVVTLETSICKGGHFYDWTLMQKTLWTLVQLTLDRGSTTNQNHDCWAECMLRFSHFFYTQHYHSRGDKTHHLLPHLKTREDWENLASLFVIVELLHVLLLENPQRTIDQYDEQFRLSLIVGRGQVRRCVNDMRAVGAPGATFKTDVFLPMLVFTVHQFKQALATESTSSSSPWSHPAAYEHVVQLLDEVVAWYPDARGIADLIRQESPSDGNFLPLHAGPWKANEGGYEIVLEEPDGDDPPSILLSYGARPSDIAFFSYMSY